MENNYNTDLSNANLLDENFSGIFGTGKGKVKSKVKKAKDKVKKAKDKVKSKVQKAKTKLKKVTTSIKKKVGNVGKKFRNNFRKVMRKDILFKINRNIHGTAVKLYPAIATQSELNNKKYRPAYILKAKKSYSDLLKKWLEFGGTEADLKAAIVSGNAKKRFLKNPYKSFDGAVDSQDFYSYFSAADGEEEEGVENEAEGIEEVPSEEEKLKGVRGFFAWLKGVFSKNGANENPFEAGTADAKDFESDSKDDVNNLPSDSEANNEIFKEISDTAGTDDAGGDTDEDAGADDEDDDKILGMPKGLAIGLGVALLAIGGYIAYKKFGK